MSLAQNIPNGASLSLGKNARLIMRAFLICAALLALTGCGGGGGGGGDKGSGNFSIGELDSAFPSFNESSLNINQGHALRWYYYGSTNAPTQYGITLQGNSFLKDKPGLEYYCDGYEYYKADRNTLACVETAGDGIFETVLIKSGGAPSDSELNAAFGSVPGKGYYVERAIAATPNSAFTKAISAYKKDLEAKSFKCSVTSYTECHKVSGNSSYQFIGARYEDEKGVQHGEAYWFVYSGGGDASAETSVSVPTNPNHFEVGDYVSNPNASFASQDPLAVYQWHLKNWGQKSGSGHNAVNTANPSFDLNVTPVWNGDLGVINGAGVTIGIVDSGTDFTHPDLKDAYNPDLSFNYFSYLNNPYPVKTGGGCAHGTMTAGIAGARGSNNYGVMGVAPQAQLAGLNLGIGCGFGTGSAPIVEAFGKGVDISSNSWSMVDPGAQYEEIDNAIIEGAKKGRSRKGRIYIFAAGNERNSPMVKNGNANYDSMRSLFESICVAALASNGKHTSYSNKGANILVSAYGGTSTSDNKNDASIFTTDIYGAAKGKGLDPEAQTQHSLNNYGQFTAYMNGTSAATPMVAGVVALMLDANPDLTWRDVRYILATTARKNDPTNSDSWAKNGAGLWVSHDYGFGAVDAYSAVQKAKEFRDDSNKPLKPLIEKTYPFMGTIGNVNFSGAGVEKKINISGSGIGKIEFVDIVVDIDDSAAPLLLNITLKSPKGTISELVRNDYEGLYDAAWTENIYSGGWRLGTARLLDEPADGDWTLTIDGGPNKNIKFRNWKLKIYGREQ